MCGEQKKRERGRKRGIGEEKRGKGEEKRGEGKKKAVQGKEERNFQRCWGRFSTMLCLENLPQHLKR